MTKILDRVHKYIPVTPYEEQRTLPNGEVVIHKDYKIHRIPVTGDQVTVARIRGAKAARHSSKNKLVMSMTVLRVLCHLWRIGMLDRHS